ncbi:MAG: nucleoside hydrolase, partial [Pseudomonas sp.]
CNQVILDPSYTARITATDPVATLVRNVFEKKTGDNQEGALPVPIFDPLATLLMTGGVAANKTLSEFLSVETKETEQDNHCGQVRVEPSGSRPIDFVVGVSQTQFAQQYANVINGA